jgi:hypothetical protein
VRAFAEAHPVSYPLLIGGAAGIDLARQLGNGNLSLPYTLLITPSVNCAWLISAPCPRGTGSCSAPVACALKTYLLDKMLPFAANLRP